MSVYHRKRHKWKSLKMGRKSRYETHILPRLKEISEMVVNRTEAEIASVLGVSVSAFEKYKTEHEELREALKKGRENLVNKLHDSLRKKAFGFNFTETKKTIRYVDGVKTAVVEEYEKYSPPDVGAIHLLLKNYDPSWTNDDKTTIDLKREKIALEKMKAEMNEW